MFYLTLHEEDLRGQPSILREEEIKGGKKMSIKSKIKGDWKGKKVHPFQRKGRLEG
jgi:hypothetical protein